MAEYRDEKETLRRRVARLEEELAEVTSEDAEQDQTIRRLRRERDALREEVDALRSELEALPPEEPEAPEERSVDPRRHASATLAWILGVGGFLLFAALLSAAGAPSELLAAGVVGCGLLGALTWAYGASAARAKRAPTREERARARAREKRARLRERRRRRVRVETERENASMEATRRRGERAKRRR